MILFWVLEAALVVASACLGGLIRTWWYENMEGHE